MVKTLVAGAALLSGCIADRGVATSASSGGEAATSASSGGEVATSGGASETSATSEVASTGTTDAATPTTGDSTGGGSSGFIVVVDGGAGVPWCDPFVQDCAEGEKCVPYACRRASR